MFIHAPGMTRPKDASHFKKKIMTTTTVFDDHNLFRKDGIYAVPENMTWPECYIKTTTAKPRE